jgi:hypothetical protein
VAGDSGGSASFPGKAVVAGLEEAVAVALIWEKVRGTARGRRCLYPRACS